MENKKSRVLAYTKATPISSEEMTQVSGGLSWCRQSTFKLSGAFGPDIVLDISADW